MLEQPNYPSVPENATEGLRLQMRTRALSDLYYFTKGILGYADLNPRTHGALCKFIVATEKLATRRMVLMPRSTFKTTIQTISNSMREACLNPEIQILIIADTSENAKRFIKEIRQHFERNELFRWVFQEIIPDDTSKVTWSATELEVKRKSVSRDPTFDAIGAGGGVESRHYHLIRADDLVTEKHIHSETEMERIIDWSRGMESLLIGIQDRIDFTGSHKKMGDLYHDLHEYYGTGRDDKIPIGPYAYRSGDLVVFSRDIREDGTSIFPERIPDEFLDRLQLHDPERYFAQYANSPIAGGINRFSEENNRFWNETASGQIKTDDGETISPWTLDRLVLFDPAVAENRKKSSKQAIIVVGKGSGPRRYILETRIGHFQPDDAIDHLLELDQKWRPMAISIEKRGYQGSIKYWLHERCRRENLPFPPIVEYPQKGSQMAVWEKDERIKALQPIHRAEWFFFRKDQKELLEEFRYYPNSKFKDALDCLAQGLDFWPYMESLEDVNIRRQKEDDMLLEAGLGRPVRDPSFSPEDLYAKMGETGYDFSY